MPEGSQRYSAGDSVEDVCKVCKITRNHSVIVADGDGRILRAQCDYCGSQHNFRGGGGIPTVTATAASSPVFVSPAAVAGTAPAPAGLEALLRHVLREELGFTPTAPAEKWRGGELVLRPGRPGLKEHVIPIDALFSKVVMVRNRLRTLEQQVNASALPDDVKLKLQSYITASYGSLTSFNVLFADDEDRFHGSGKS